MYIDFNNNTPIYLQIIETLKTYIISGKYKLGEKLPSIRDLSLEIKVNPNTLQKALVELQNIGLIYTDRTNGKYVTSDEKLIAKIKREYARNLTKDYINNMKKLNYSIDEIKSMIGE